MVPAGSGPGRRPLTLSERFLRFAEHEARESSPLYARLAEGVHDQAEVLALFDGVDPRQQRPNLLFAAVHDVLLRGAGDELRAYYPSVGGRREPDERVLDAFLDFIRRHRDEVLELMSTRSTQTNEVRRSALMLPALAVTTRDDPRPVALVDVGAAAGLNLLLDQFSYRYDGSASAGSGGGPTIRCAPRDSAPLPDLSRPIGIADRVGIDLQPLDPASPADARWLRACVWPEHEERLALLDAALDLARWDPPRLVTGHALDLLPEVASGIPDDRHVCVIHSAALAYFTPGQRDAFGTLLEDIGARRRLSTISLEGPFVPPFEALDAACETAPPNATYFAIGLTTFVGGERSDLLLGRGDPHGAWIQWLAGHGEHD